MTVDEPAALNIHAACVALGGAAALLRGAPGSGKSDLALRFLHQPRLALLKGLEPALVADDRTLLSVSDGRLMARPPEAIAGLIEIRGLGVEQVAFAPQAEVRLIADLDPAACPPRLPPDPWPCERILGVDVPRFALAAFEASAPVKLTLAMLKFA